MKNEQGRVFREIDERGVVAVRNRDHIDGFLLSPAVFDELRAGAEDASRLRAALPLLLAAARSGVAIPSDTFDTLGIPVREDWKALNELMASLPLTIAEGEDGEQLPALSAIDVRHEPVEELDDELIVR